MKDREYVSEITALKKIIKMQNDGKIMLDFSCYFLIKFKISNEKKKNQNCDVTSILTSFAVARQITLASLNLTFYFDMV